MRKFFGFILFMIITLAVSIIVLEGVYRINRLIKHGHVKYVFLDTVGGFCNHDVYGNAFTPCFDSTKLPKDIRFGEEGKGYGLDKVIKMNNNGFRTHEFTIKQEKVYRIITIGGSTTFCYGDNDNTWPAFLEKFLNHKARAGYRFEVFNLGVGGWRSIEEKLVFKNEVINLRPDLVTLYTGWNDLAGSRNKITMNKAVHFFGLPQCANQVKNIKSEVLSARTPSFFERYFLLYNQLENRVFYKFLRNRFDDWEDGLKGDRDASRAWVVAWKKNIHEIVDSARQHGIKIVSIDYPCLAREAAGNTEKRTIFQNTRVNDERIFSFWVKAKEFLSYHLHLIGNEENIPTIEASKYFENFQGQERVSLFTDEMHLTEKGNKLLGEYLAGQLFSQKDDLGLTEYFSNNN